MKSGTINTINTEKDNTKKCIKVRGGGEEGRVITSILILYFTCSFIERLYDKRIILVFSSNSI